MMTVTRFSSLSSSPPPFLLSHWLSAIFFCLVVINLSMHAIAISAIRRCTPFAGTAIRSIGVIEKPEGHSRRIEHVVTKLLSWSCTTNRIASVYNRGGSNNIQVWLRKNGLFGIREQSAGTAVKHGWEQHEPIVVTMSFRDTRSQSFSFALTLLTWGLVFARSTANRTAAGKVDGPRVHQKESWYYRYVGSSSTALTYEVIPAMMAAVSSWSTALSIINDHNIKDVRLFIYMDRSAQCLRYVRRRRCMMATASMNVKVCI